MDYDRVNDVLEKANAEFERQELEDLQDYEIDDLEMGRAPTAEDLDRIEEIGPFEGYNKQIKLAATTIKRLEQYAKSGDVKLIKDGAQTLIQQAQAIAGSAKYEQEGYVGDGGTEPPDNTPDGDPIEGGDSGVDNLASDAEQYMSYVAELAVSISVQTGISDDEALNAVVAVAGELADAGKLPPMPDVDTASAEELAQWTGAAKTSGLLDAIISKIDAEMDKEHVTVPMGEPTGDAPAS